MTDFFTTTGRFFVAITGRFLFANDTLTLTTITFDYSSLEWFEIFSCKTISEGQPPSFI
jgi:hypothetical protein